LRQAALAPIGLDHFSDVYSWLFFRHDVDPQSTGVA
jgi:hypothetical protein